MHKLLLASVAIVLALTAGGPARAMPTQAQWSCIYGNREHRADVFEVCHISDDDVETDWLEIIAAGPEFFDPWIQAYCRPAVPRGFTCTYHGRTYRGYDR